MGYDGKSARATQLVGRAEMGNDGKSDRATQFQWGVLR